MHEIITLQLGQRANYLATHFWNLQESYFTYGENEESLIDHDIHFRAGVGADGTDTFTPRTVIYDLKGGFGSLRKYNALYEITENSALLRGLWDGSTLPQLQNVIEPSKYQRRLNEGLPTFQLKTSDVRYWSDFNRLFYHPRSIVQLNEYELGSQLMPFENWSAGEELYHTLDKEHDILDRDLRPFAEECDQLQGLQIFTGADDAWGGFSSKYLDDLRDEFGKSSIWIYGLEDSRKMPRQKKILRACNTAKSLQSLAPQASAYTRLCTTPGNLPDYVNLDTASEWCTSALLCSAIESATLPTRIRANGGQQGSLALLEAAMNTTGKQTIFELRSSVEMQLQTEVNGRPKNHAFNQPDLLIQEDTEHDVSACTYDIAYLDGLATAGDHHFGQVKVYRHSAAHAVATNVFSTAVPRQNQEDETVVANFDARTPFPLLDTFPDTLFRIDGTSSLNMRAGMFTTSRTKHGVIDIRNMTRMATEVDEREAIYNDLTEIANNYSHGWESGSDSDDDDT